LDKLKIGTFSEYSLWQKS